MKSERFGDHMQIWNLELSEFVSYEQDVNFAAVEEGHFRMDVPATGGKVVLKGPPGKTGGADWEQAKFLIMDIYHQSHDVLVILVEFRCHEGVRQNDIIEAHFGVLPGLPTRLCFPLAALNSEKLFLSRFPGTLQTVLRGGSGIIPAEINQISIGTVDSVMPRSFRISGAHLSDTEPDFPVPNVPFTDELGQYISKQWPGKTPDTEALTAYLRAEKATEEQSTFYTNAWGRYGGWKGLQFQASGFFRTQHDGKRWWLVDPEGYPFISTGLDCVTPGETMKVDGMEHLVSWLPEEEGPFSEAWKRNDGRPGRYFNFAVANLIRAFGSQWWESWAVMTKRRLHEWGFNTVANWSQPAFVKSAQMPYVWPLTGFPSTKKLIFRDFPDVFSEEYQAEAIQFAKQLEAFRGDPLLIGYFLRNEPSWAFVDNLNITEKLLEHPEPFASKHRLASFIMERYDRSLAAWNLAWHTEFESFDRLLQPISQASALSPQAAADLHDFNRLMIEAYVKIPAVECKKTDVEHLNLGMRYAWISSDLLYGGSEYFDVFSINTYQMKPDAAYIRQISEATGLPVMIGEFHHGAADVGMLANGIRGVATQEDRGNGYKYFVENGAAIPELVGMHYFILNDQALLGRFDGENYQIGAVDVCHRPYEAFIHGVIEAHSAMYQVANGDRPPYREYPTEIPKTGF